MSWGLCSLAQHETYTSRGSEMELPALLKSSHEPSSGKAGNQALDHYGEKSNLILDGWSAFCHKSGAPRVQNNIKARLKTCNTEKSISLTCWQDPFICLFIYFCAVWVPAPWDGCRGQRITHRNTLPPFTMWLPGTELNLSGLVASAFTCWDILPPSKVWFKKSLEPGHVAHTVIPTLKRLG